MGDGFGVDIPTWPLVVGAVYYLGTAIAVGVVAHDHYGRSAGGWILLSLL